MSNGGFNRDGTYKKEDRVDPFYRDPEFHLPIHYNSEGHIRASLINLDMAGFGPHASVHAQLAVASALQELRAEIQELVGILRVDLNNYFGKEVVGRRNFKDDE